MNLSISVATIELVLFGSLLVGVAVLVIAGLVRELAPAQRYRWMLGVGLGTGVAAFAMKIGLVLTFSYFSVPLLDILPTPSQEGSVREGLSRLHQQTQSSTDIPLWQALPSVAPSPEQNPQTAEKIVLGRLLFNDTNLSYDRTLSCASCHEINLEKGGADGLPTSTGIYQQSGTRNAPTVLNAAFQTKLFWDGRASTLEEQALGPFVNAIEMGMPNLEAVLARVLDDHRYPPLFAKAFPLKPKASIENIAKAIAAYERTLITPDSPYDRFIKGDQNAMSPQQIRGMALFESTGCSHCHSGPNFSAASIFSDTSSFRAFPANSNRQYEQRYALLDDKGLNNALAKSQKGLWRVPSLRNVSLTAPYFHNGSVETLEEAVRIMATVQLDKVISDKSKDDQRIYWRSTDRRFNVDNNSALSEDEVLAIVAFLEALSGKLPEQTINSDQRMGLVD